jgi:thiamine biosynthesis lipoprotein
MLALLFLAAPLANPAGAELVERRVASMGTVLEIAIAAPTRERALDASERALREIQRVEDRLTTWRDSPLARLNAAPVGEGVPLDDELSGVLAATFAWAARTDRAFDPTVMPLVRAWDLRGAGRVPDPEALAAALRATGTGRFRFGTDGRSLARLEAGAGIEEGAWGKGYALDRALEKLGDVTGALIDLGGQVAARGKDAAGHDWSIAIADPRRRDRPVLELRLPNASASTSGDSERSRVVDGRRIGHLLDPRTGEPAEDFGSVTVIAPSALDADVLSTAFFVLGPDRGLELSERLRGEGVPNEVLFLIVRGESLEARSSSGISRFVISADTTVVRGLSTER